MRILLIVLSILYVASASFARSIVTRSDACAVSADADRYTPARNVETQNLNRWGVVADDVTPRIDHNVANTSRADQVFVRLHADAKTGSVFDQPEDFCED